MWPRLRLFMTILGLAAAPVAPASAQLWVGPAAPSAPAMPTGDFRLFSLDEALLRISADLPPAARRSILAEDPALGMEGVRFSRDRSWPDGLAVIPRNMLQASYDKPVPGSGLTILGSSAVADRPAAHHADGWSNAARSNLGLHYNDFGIRLTVNPDVEANWGVRIADRMHYGVTGQLDTDLAKDLTLSLYSRYEAWSYSDAWLDYSEQRKFATASYNLGDGYVVSLAAREISGTNNWETWSLTGPALKFSIPVAERLALTLDNELLFSERAFHDGHRPPTGYHRNHNLQASWSPAAFAKYALTILAGYTLHYDSAAERQFAYHNLARVAVTMKF